MTTSRSAPGPSLLHLLAALPGSYAGPTAPRRGPYAASGSGEATLAALLAAPLIPASLTSSGTQFVLGSPGSERQTREEAALAEAAGAEVRRVSTGGAASGIDTLIPGGPLATYHGAQYLAYASAHADDAAAAEALLSELATRCASESTEDNPARELAWTLHHRTPLLLADAGAEAQLTAWQHLLARVGKTYAAPVLGDPVAVVSGMFEGRHEQGDAKVAVLLGDPSPELDICREILETRVDEVVEVPYLPSESLYAQGLALWYLGAWTAAYLADLSGQPAEDSPVLRRAEDVLAGSA